MVVDLSLDGHPKLPSDVGRCFVFDPNHRDEPAGRERLQRASGLSRITGAPELPANEPAELELLSPRMVARDEADKTDGLAGVTEG